MDMKTEIYRCLLDLYFCENGKKEQKLTDKAYAGICSIVEVVGDRVEFISNQLNIDPFVLEQLIYCVNYLDEREPDTVSIERTLKDAGVDRAIWDKDSNSLILVIHGLEYLVPLSHLKKLIEGQILPIYEKYHWRDFMLYVTTRHTDRYLHTPASFMMLYTIFKSITGMDNSKSFAITRFKGLGEMSQEDILGTCVDPHTRCTFRISSMGDANQIYSMLGADSEARKQLSDNSLHGRLIDQGLLEE
jgi:DNA gyrase/topoisomerase IV subunit B